MVARVPEVPRQPFAVLAEPTITASVALWAIVAFLLGCLWGCFRISCASVGALEESKGPSLEPPADCPSVPLSQACPHTDSAAVSAAGTIKDKDGAQQAMLARARSWGMAAGRQHSGSLRPCRQGRGIGGTPTLICQG